MSPILLDGHVVLCEVMFAMFWHNVDYNYPMETRRINK
jgi:hypothetical protein